MVSADNADMFVIQTSQQKPNGLHHDPSKSSVSINMEYPETPTSSSSRHSKSRKHKISASDTQSKDKINKEKSVRTGFLARDMSYRFKRQKTLKNRLTMVNDISCFFAMVGIVLMVATNEMNFTRIQDVTHLASWVLNLCITCSTVILLTLIVYYHRLQLELHCTRNGLGDWRIGLTNSRILMITLELAICAIHPFPRELIVEEPSMVDTPYSLSYTSIDVGLGIPMFIRLYLVCRTLLLHSHLMRDTAVQSLGSFNNVSMNFLFLIKTYLEQWPARCMIIFCGILFFVGSWCLRACNYTSDLEHFTIGNSMWLFLITYTTVGYGDLYPSSTSGRVIAGMIGILGILSSAFLIAIVTQKLTFRREEKYVHTFVLNIELAKKRRTQAADIIKSALKIWLLKRKDKFNTLRYVQAQRHLFSRILAIQTTKKHQKLLRDTCVGFHELMTVQRSTGDMLETVVPQITDIQNEFTVMEQKLMNFDNRLVDLQKSMDIVLNHIKEQSLTL